MDQKSIIWVVSLYLVFAFSALGDPGDPAAVREEIWLPQAPYGSLYKGGTRGDVVIIFRV
jgi:hypothetical protein